MDLVTSHAPSTLEACCLEEGLFPKGSELPAGIETRNKAAELGSVPALPNLDVISASISLVFTLCPPIYKVEKGKQEDRRNGGGRGSNVLHLLQISSMLVL